MAASRGSTRPTSLTASASELPSTSSITIHGRLSCSSTSWTVTTAEWLIRAAARASASGAGEQHGLVALGTYSAAVNSLMATARCSTSSCARHTRPMPPLPMESTSR